MHVHSIHSVKTGPLVLCGLPEHDGILPQELLLLARYAHVYVYCWPVVTGKLSDMPAAHSLARATSAWRPTEYRVARFRHLRKPQSKDRGALGESI
jgi:hypothetical protein